MPPVLLPSGHRCRPASTLAGSRCRSPRSPCSPILSLARGDESAPGGRARRRRCEGRARRRARSPPSSAKDRDGAARVTTSKAPVPTDAQLVAESTFSLALPAGWERVTPAAGATFAAVSSDSTADATLWIQNDPKLDMATFEANSLQQLEIARRQRRGHRPRAGPDARAELDHPCPQGRAGGSARVRGRASVGGRQLVLPRDHAPARRARGRGRRSRSHPGLFRRPGRQGMSPQSPDLRARADRSRSALPRPRPRRRRSS